LALVLYAVAKSKRLSEALETLADERAALGEKLRAFSSVWSRQRARRRHKA
jgi:hypothetical protein